MEVAVEMPAKPAAVRLLQVLGVILLAVSILPLLVGAIVHYDKLEQVTYLAFFPAVAGVCALGAGWRRPIGLVLGMVSLSLLLVTLIGAILVALVGFLAARDREQIRDFYASGIKR